MVKIAQQKKLTILFGQNQEQGLNIKLNFILLETPQDLTSSYMQINSVMLDQDGLQILKAEAMVDLKECFLRMK